MRTFVFNLAQSFFVDADAVKGAKKVDLSSIDLYFKKRPKPINNKSGIRYPGVNIFLTTVDADRKPDLKKFISGNINATARLEYTDIDVSPDASVATRARFNKLVSVETGKEYAIVVMYDGNEEFALWSSRKGDLLLGTNKKSPGPSGKYDGVYFDGFTATADGDDVADDITSKWKAKNDVDLKFAINVARYNINGQPVSTTSFSQNTIITEMSPAVDEIVDITYDQTKTTYSISGRSHEFVTFDKKTSTAFDSVRSGEQVYQNTVPYPGGSASHLSISIKQGSDLITANATLPNGQPFNWNSVYSANIDTEEYIVLISDNDPSANKRKTDIKRVLSIESNTVLRVDSGVEFTNTAAKFIKSPVATIKTIKTFRHVDIPYYLSTGKRRKVDKRMLVLVDSNANSSVRFVNNTINSISITAAGGGYSNTDYLTITGYETSSLVKGGYPAKANVVTNASGNITAIYLSNVGCGYVNVANLSFTISNNTGGSTTGTGANFSATVGTVLRTEFDGDISRSAGNKGMFNDCSVINFDYSTVIPSADLNAFAGSTYNMSYYNPYYRTLTNSTYIGYAYYCDNLPNRNAKSIRNFYRSLMTDKNVTVFPSRSNEFVIIDDVTNVPQTTPVPGSGVVVIDTTSNNDFVAIRPTRTAVTLGNYSINNDYTGENTDYGLAACKHVSTKIAFDRDRFSEDIVVYLTAYRPLNTDIKVYARIHNSNDTEAFDDKDWTLLDLKSDNIYSSSADPFDYIEMSYGFNNYPNTVSTLAGTATVANETTLTVTGQSTSFDTALLPSDLVKIYSPLFPNNYAISVVDSVDSATQITLTRPTGNVDVTGSGLKIDFLGRVGNSTVDAVGYPMQAFNNKLNDNVVRYYNSSMVEFDTYDTLQLKIVLLSDIDQVTSINPDVFPTTIPRVDDVRAIGVTV